MAKADFALFSLGVYLWGVAIALDFYTGMVRRQRWHEALVIALLSWSGAPWVFAIAAMEGDCD
jgi:hypothetical protein